MKKVLGFLVIATIALVGGIFFGTYNGYIERNGLLKQIVPEREPDYAEVTKVAKYQPCTLKLAGTKLHLTDAVISGIRKRISQQKDDIKQMVKEVMLDKTIGEFLPDYQDEADTAPLIGTYELPFQKCSDEDFRSGRAFAWTVYVVATGKESGVWFSGVWPKETPQTEPVFFYYEGTKEYKLDDEESYNTLLSKLESKNFHKVQDGNYTLHLAQSEKYEPQYQTQNASGRFFFHDPKKMNGTTDEVSIDAGFLGQWTIPAVKTADGHTERSHKSFAFDLTVLKKKTEPDIAFPWEGDGFWVWKPKP